MDGENPVYNLDEALASVGFGKFQLLVLAYAGLGGFADSVEIMILSIIGPAVKSQWKLSPSQESLLSTVVFAGMIVGAFCWGFVSDHHGRRKGFLGLILTTSVPGLLSAFSPNYAFLVIIRCLVGFGLGGGSVYSSWFIEFVPASQRGTRMVLISLCWTFGAIFEASLAWIVMPILSWRWLLALSSLPSFALLLFYPLVPESPRYLCTMGRVNDAHNILEKIALLNHSELPPGMLVSDNVIGLGEEPVPSKCTLQLSSAGKMDLDFRSYFSSLRLLFSSKLIRTTLLLWEVYFGILFAYYGIILLISELSSGQSKCVLTFIRSKNHDSLYRNVFITNLAELPGLLLSAIMIDRIGRKFSIASLCFLACIFLSPLVFHQSATVTTALLFGARMCTKGLYPLASTYSQELYPTAVRATGAGAGNAIGKVGGMICPLVAVGLVSHCQLTEAIILFVVVIGVSIVCVLFFPLETNGRELNDRVDCGTDPNRVVAVAA